MPCTASVPVQMSRAASLGAGIQALGRRITAALAVRAERRALMGLDEWALKDMASTRARRTARQAARSGMCRWIGCGPE